MTNIRLITAIAVMILLVNLPSTIDYARAYKKMSFLHEKALSFLQETAKVQEILLFVDGDSRWPYWGLAGALRLQGLNVEEEEENRLLVHQVYETNSIGKNSHAMDISETVQEDPVPDEFVYVGFYTFWESFWPSAEPHQVTVRRYLEDVQHYIQVFPDSPSNDVDELSIYIFRKSIHTPA